MMARILLPLRSWTDPDSLRRELEYIFPLPAEIHLLHVLAESLPGSSVDPGRLLTREREARSFLEKAGGAFWPVRIRTWLRRGDPAEEICLAATEFQADLIALLGSPSGEGHPGTKRGAVTRGVLRKSQQPVLASGRLQGTPGPPRRILVLEGEAPWTERALGLLRSMSHSPRADVVILELSIPILLPEGPSQLSGVVSVPERRVPLGGETTPAETLQHLGFPTRVVTLREHAVSAVERVAREVGADLILLPREGSSPLKGGFLSPRDVDTLYRRLEPRLLLVPA